MSETIRLSDHRLEGVASRAAATMVASGLVHLELEEGNWVLGLASDSATAEKFLRLNETSPAALMFVDFDAASDLIVQPSRTMRRLLRGKCGPLLVELPQQVVDSSLLAELPEAARQLVQRDRWVRLAPPPGLVTSAVLQQSPGPLLVCGSRSSDAEPLYDILITDASGASPLPGQVRVDGEGWEITQAEGMSVSDIERMIAQRILFVCTGNTCRSPMAEAMFRVLLAERLHCAPGELLEHGYEVSSAGLAAMRGAPASPESVEICAERGVDLAGHASQPLTEALLERADRLYTMTAGHREAILSRYPNLQDRVEVLSRNGRDVSDPIGYGRSAYEQCYTEITENLSVLVDELARSADDDHRHDAET